MLREDLGAGFRIFSHKAYIGVYRVVKGGIQVLRVVYGRRNYPALFP